jgi:hypothetical protein
MSGATPSRSHPPKGHHLGGQSDGVAQYEHLGSMIGAISEERCLIMTGGPDESQLAGPQHSQPNMNAHEQPLTEKDALAWLLAKPSIETTVSELSRQWGWNRTKVLRRLKRWADDGYLIRTTAPGGRSVITTLHKGVHPPDSGASTSAILVPRTAVAAISGPSVHPAEGDDQDGHVLFSAAPTNSLRALIRIVASIALAALAAAIAGSASESMHGMAAHWEKLPRPVP